MLLYFLLFFSVSEWESAVESFKQGLYAPALYTIENLLLQEEFVKKDSAYLLAADASFFLEKYEKALAYYKKFLSLSYNDSLKKVSLERAVLSSIALDAEDKGVEVLNMYPYIRISKSVVLKLGKQLENKGKYLEAAKVYLISKEYEEYVHSAFLFYKAYQKDEAIKTLEEAEKKFKSQKDKIRFYKFSIYFEDKDTLNALNAVSQIENVNALEKKERVQVAEFLYKLNLYDMALDFVKGIDSPLYLDILRKLKKYEDLRSILEKRKYSEREERELEKIKCLLEGKCKFQYLVDIFYDEEELLEISSILLKKKQLNILRYFIPQLPQDWRSFFIKGEFYYLSEKYDSALFYYKKFLDCCIFSSKRDYVEKRIFEIENFKLTQPQVALKMLLKTQSIDDKIQVIFKYAKDYNEVVKIGDTVNSPISFYYTGLAYYNLWKKENKKYYLEKASNKFKTLFWKYPEDSLAEYALYYIFKTEKKEMDKYEYGLDYLDHYPEGKFYYEILYNIAVMELSFKDTSAAFETLNLLYLSQKNNFTFPALYLIAMIEAKEDITEAINKLEVIRKLGNKDSLYLLSLCQLIQFYKEYGNNVEAFHCIKQLAEFLGVLPTQIFETAKEITEKIENPQIFEGMKLTSSFQQNYFEFIKILKLNTSYKDKILKLLRLSSIGFETDYYYFLALSAEKAGYKDIAKKGYKIAINYGRRKNITKKATVALSEIYLKDGDVQQAKKILEKAYTNFPEDQPIISRFIVTLYRSGEIKKADSLWEFLDKKTFIDTSPLLLEKVAYFIQASRYVQADSVLRFLENLRDVRKNKNFLFYKGLVEFKMGNFEKAIVYFREFFKKFPKDRLIPEIYFKMGTSFYQIGNLDSATYYYKKAGSFSGFIKRKDALINVVVIYKQQEKWDDMIEVLHEIEDISLSPEEKAQVYHNMGYAYLQKRAPLDALKYFKRALQYAKEKRTLRDIIYWLGETYYALGQPEKAIEEFLKIPDFGEQEWTGTALMRAGIIYELLGNYKKAEEIYKRMLKIFAPDSIWSMQAKERLKKLRE